MMQDLCFQEQHKEFMISLPWLLISPLQEKKKNIFNLDQFLDTVTSMDTWLCCTLERGDNATKEFFKLVLMFNLIIFASEFNAFI